MDAIFNNNINLYAINYIFALCKCFFFNLLLTLVLPQLSSFRLFDNESNVQISTRKLFSPLTFFIVFGTIELLFLVLLRVFPNLPLNLLYYK